MNKNTKLIIISTVVLVLFLSILFFINKKNLPENLEKENNVVQENKVQEKEYTENQFREGLQNSISFEYQEYSVTCSTLEEKNSSSYVIDDSPISFVSPIGYKKTSDLYAVYKKTGELDNCKFSKELRDGKHYLDFSFVEPLIEDQVYGFFTGGDSFFGVYQKNNFWTYFENPPTETLEKYSRSDGLQFFKYGGGEEGFSFTKYILPIPKFNKWLVVNSHYIPSSLDIDFPVEELLQTEKSLLDSIKIN